MIRLEELKEEIDNAPARIRMLRGLQRFGKNHGKRLIGGATYLHLCAISSVGQRLTSLVAKSRKKDLNKQDSVEGSTPLHLMASNNFLEGVAALLEAKADVNALNGRNKTPVAVAKLHHAKEAMQLLRRFGGLESVAPGPGAYNAQMVQSWRHSKPSAALAPSEGEGPGSQTPPAETLELMMILSPPLAPLIKAVVAVEPGLVQIFWHPSHSKFDVVSYEVAHLQDGRFRTVHRGSCEDDSRYSDLRTFTVHGLEPNAIQQFRVRARSTAIFGPWSQCEGKSM